MRSFLLGTRDLLFAIPVLKSINCQLAMHFPLMMGVELCNLGAKKPVSQWNYDSPRRTRKGRACVPQICSAGTSHKSKGTPPLLRPFSLHLHGSRGKVVLESFPIPTSLSSLHSDLLLAGIFRHNLQFEKLSGFSPIKRTSSLENLAGKLFHTPQRGSTG